MTTTPTQPRLYLLGTHTQPAERHLKPPSATPENASRVNSARKKHTVILVAGSGALKNIHTLRSSDVHTRASSPKDTAADSSKTLPSNTKISSTANGHTKRKKNTRWIPPTRPALTASEIELVALPHSDIHLHTFLSGVHVKPPPTSRSLVDSFFVGRAPLDGYSTRVKHEKGFDNPPDAKELTQLRVSNPYGYRNYVKAEEKRKDVADTYGRLEAARTGIAARVNSLKDYTERLQTLIKENHLLKKQYQSLSQKTNGFVTKTLGQAEDNDSQAVELLSRRRKRIKALRDEAAKADVEAKTTISELESRASSLESRLSESTKALADLITFRDLADNQSEALSELVQAEIQKRNELLRDHAHELRVFEGQIRASNAKVESEALIRVRAAVSDDVIEWLPNVGKTMVADAQKTRSRLELEMSRHRRVISELQEQILSLEAEMAARRDQMKEQDNIRKMQLDEKRREIAAAVAAET
ncbi:hypothetical protein SmJEL517_g00922 [Synchytrium microbalum]|uniref:Uncharacterized protein n=1 Tax=Synchytrium microbalum TaxID=1806994 RepID=A0A507CGI8_9FUNG|nr:uncharacterized protein SmJEL517_g00922 [Synchytrium microbalum]TPX37094.1 hypothetical protein SmJEL517_g00922 [Synchytrium microbalum]